MFESQTFKDKMGQSVVPSFLSVYDDPSLPRFEKTDLNGFYPYDDEGVKTQRWDLIKDGILVNYQAIRDQAHILGLKESQGCCYADN